MRIISSVLVFVLTIYAVPWAQTQSLSATESLAGPVLAAGTRLRVKLDSTLSTNVARPSDTVEAIVTKRIDRNGVVVLPQGARIHGKVEAVRRADRNNKVEPSLKLNFDQIIFPDGRVFSTSASIADVRKRMHVDSIGLVTQPGLSGRRKLVSIALFSATGALAGIHSGGEGSGIGAAAGAGLGGLVVSLDSRPYSDFELKKGRKLWLRLNSDLR